MSVHITSKLRGNFIFSDMKHPLGFLNQTDSSLSFDNGTRTFTIQPAVSLFTYYISGVLYAKSSAESIQISNTEGLHYIYYDGDTLAETTTFSVDLFITYAYVASLYWDTDNSWEIYFGNERHEINMPGTTHYREHIGDGTVWVNGIGLGDFTADGDGSSDTHAQLSCANGTILDEDIFTTITDGSPQDISPILQAPIYYKSGASGYWRRDAATNFPVKSFSGGSNLLAWNQNNGGTWQQTEVTSGQYVLAHIYAINDINNPIIAVQGQQTYGNIPAAREGAETEIVNLATEGLPFAEAVAIGSVIYQTRTSYSNAVQALVRTTDTGANYVDFRRSQGISAGNPFGLPEVSELEVISVRFAGAKGDGITDDYTAINNAINAIGTDEQTLYFGPGTYYIGTSISTPANVKIRFDKGAIIQDNGDAGITFTIADSGGIDAGPYQIFNFTGAGSGATFTNGGEGFVNWWVDDGVGTSGDPWTSPTDSAGISEAITAGLTDIKLTTGEYLIDAPYTTGLAGFTGRVLRGEGAVSTLINYSDTSGDILTLDGTQIDIRDFRMVGPGTGGTENALTVQADTGGTRAYVSRVNILDCGGFGFTLGNSNTCCMGIQASNCGSGLVRIGNTGGTVSIGGGSYLLGTRLTTTYGLSVPAGMSNNNVHIYDTNIENCDYGIYSGGALGDFRNITLTNVHFEANVTADVRASSQMESLILNGCRIGGNSSNTTATGLDLNSATSCNIILNGGRFGGYETEQIDWPNSNSGKFVILAEPQGIDYATVARNLSNDVPITNTSKWLSQCISDVSTSDTGEDDLASVILPQNSQNVYRVIRIKAAGTKTNLNGNKTLKFYCGTDSITFHPAINVAGDWRFTAEMTLTGASERRCSWSGFHESVTHGYSSFTTDDLSAGNITLKVTGECADGADTITQTMFIVELV